MESNSKKSVIKNSSKNTKNDVMEKNIKKDKGVKIPKDIKMNINSAKGKFYIKSKITFAIFIIIVAIVIVAIIVLCVNIFVKGNINANAKMDAYGFSKLYDSGTSNESENITKSEAIKMVVAATLNKDDITDMIDPSLFLSNYKGIEEDITPLLEYKNQVWVEYAKAMNFVGATNITKDNEGEKVTEIYIIELLADAKKNILQQALTTSKEKDYNVKNLSSLYNASEQLALKDMVDNEIIENKDFDFKQIATKKEMNELLINFVNKYNTITVNNEKININPAKVPNNSEEYPYTLASVDKKIYEYENYKSDEENYKTPIAYYAESKKYYYKIEEKINEYFNTILNVNYENLNEEAFTESIFDACEGNASSVMIKNYLNKVKEKHIKITGSAKVEYPAIYFDGTQMRVRTKVEYTIENADSLENVIFGDINSQEVVTYEKKKTEEIIDVPINVFEELERVFISNVVINDCKVGKVKETSFNNNIDENTDDTTATNDDVIHGDFVLNVESE